MALRVLYFTLICLLVSAENDGQLTTVKESDVKHQNDNTTILLNHLIQHTSSVNLVQRETLNDIPSYILLKEDRLSLLPRTFTICSTASSSIGEIVLFTLLNDDGNQVLNGFFSNEAVRTKGKKESETGFFISGAWISTPSALGLVFPQEWVRSCLALSTESGLAQGVVEGQLVLNQTFEILTQDGVLPRNLRNRLLLGALQWEGDWYASSGKVSNLNVFSSALSTEAMKKITTDNTASGECDLEGDYLAWKDMEWNMRGRVGKENEKQENICDLRQELIIFHTPFQNMFSCMELCTKFGTRAPSIVTFDEWSSLQLFLKEELFDKSLNSTLKIWMSVLKTDDQWRDFYSNQLVEYPALKTNNESEVSGKWWERQSCVAQGNTNRLYFHKK